MDNGSIQHVLPRNDTSHTDRDYLSQHPLRDVRTCNETCSQRFLPLMNSTIRINLDSKDRSIFLELHKGPRDNPLTRRQKFG